MKIVDIEFVQFLLSQRRALTREEEIQNSVLNKFLGSDIARRNAVRAELVAAYDKALSSLGVTT